MECIGKHWRVYWRALESVGEHWKAMGKYREVAHAKHTVCTQCVYLNNAKQCAAHTVYRVRESHWIDSAGSPLPSTVFCTHNLSDAKERSRPKKAHSVFSLQSNASNASNASKRQPNGSNWKPLAASGSKWGEKRASAIATNGAVLYNGAAAVDRSSWFFRFF